MKVFKLLVFGSLFFFAVAPLSAHDGPHAAVPVHATTSGKVDLKHVAHSKEVWSGFRLKSAKRQQKVVRDIATVSDKAVKHVPGVVKHVRIINRIY
jgi:hypothetical protein